MRKTKDKNNILKRLSLMICCLITFTTIYISYCSVNAGVSNKPSFKVTIDSYSPQPASLGENMKYSEVIEVDGKIQPQPFEIEIKPKEIVLVLDISESMIECTFPKSTHIGDYQKQEENGSWVWKNTYDSKQLYIHNYCSKHKKVGKHLSYDDNNKIEDLKIAAQNFITKMEKEPNLKIGIVTFENEANILSDLTNDFVRLKEKVKNLSAGGGTNIGGGLRKAAYLLSSGLQQNNDANKSLVLMSDGEPNKFDLKHEQFRELSEYAIQGFVNHLYDFYGINYTPQYYTDITQENFPSDVRSVNGPKEDSNVDIELKFATEIGKIVKQKGYNVYSIGYDLKNITNIDAVATLKSIHGSMSNYSENFFESDIGAIDRIFNNVAERILQGFVTDIKFKFDPTDEKIEVVDGNNIDLGSVKYIGIQDGNKIKYTAEDVPFKIKIQSKVAGYEIPIFINSTITGKWQGKNIEPANVPMYKIDVLSNSQKPKFDIKIESYLPNPASLGEEIQVNGKIFPQDFYLPIKEKEIVLVLDTTSSMWWEKVNGQNYHGKKFENLIQAAKNFTQRMSQVEGVKIGVVNIGKEGYPNIINGPDGANFCTLDSKNKPTLLDSKANYETLISCIDKLKTGGETNIGEGVRKAAYLLHQSTNKNASKTIVLMTDGEPNRYKTLNGGYYTNIGEEDNEYSNIPTSSDYKKGADYSIEIGGKIKQEQYNVFSIGYALEKEGYKTLNTIHSSMSDNEDNFFESDIGAIDGIFDKIADKILDGIVSDIKFNFSPINEQIEVIGGNIINLNNVKYTGTQNGSKIIYKADPVPFTIPIKSNIVGNKIPIFINSTVTGKWQNENLEPAKVPKFYIDVLDNILVQHGMYRGIDENTKKPNIENIENIENAEITFAKGSTITLGALIEGTKNGDEILLEVAKDVTIIGNIKVFKITDLGVETFIGSMEFKDGKYRYTLSDFSGFNCDLLIRYSELVPNARGLYPNYIKVRSPRQFPATVKVVDKELPDLF